MNLASEGWCLPRAVTSAPVNPPTSAWATSCSAAPMPRLATTTRMPSQMMALAISAASAARTLRSATSTPMRRWTMEAVRTRTSVVSVQATDPAARVVPTAQHATTTLRPPSTMARAITPQMVVSATVSPTSPSRRASRVAWPEHLSPLKAVARLPDSTLPSTTPVALGVGRLTCSSSSHPPTETVSNSVDSPARLPQDAMISVVTPFGPQVGQWMPMAFTPPPST